MDKLKNWEYGINKLITYTLTLNMTNPISGTALQLADLYIRMYVKKDFDDDALFYVQGTLNSTNDNFEFQMTQEQANLMTIGVWLVGIETHLTDVNGNVLLRDTFSRKIINTAAKA